MLAPHRGQKCVPSAATVAQLLHLGIGNCLAAGSGRLAPMGRNVTQKLIEDHLVEGEMEPGTEIGLRVDQTLTQDATGTVVMLELEAMGLDRVCASSASSPTGSAPRT